MLQIKTAHLINAPFSICMNPSIYNLKQFLLPFIFFVVTAFVAIFAQQSRNWLLPLLFLLLPLADIFWRLPRVRLSKYIQINWVVFISLTVVLLFKNPEIFVTYVVMVLVAALPEEWFFRAYMQKRLGNNVFAVLIASIMFSLLHFITQASFVAWFVFIPSVFFGLVYKITGDFIFVVILHAFSNLIFYIYFESLVVSYFVE